MSHSTKRTAPSAFLNVPCVERKRKSEPESRKMRRHPATSRRDPSGEERVVGCRVQVAGAWCEIARSHNAGAVQVADSLLSAYDVTFCTRAMQCRRRPGAEREKHTCVTISHVYRFICGHTGQLSCSSQVLHTQHVNQRRKRGQKTKAK